MHIEPNLYRTKVASFERVGWGEERTPTSPARHNNRWGSFFTPTYRVELQTDDAIPAGGRDGRHLFFHGESCRAWAALLMDHIDVLRASVKNVSFNSEHSLFK
jgi:hypothetical protein